MRRSFLFAFRYITDKPVQSVKVRTFNASIQPQTEGPEWEEARQEGCQSPAELCLLKAIRAAGLPEPEKQYRVTDEQGNLVTIPDLA